MSGPILLDTGASERGWSWYGDAFRCLHLFGLRRMLAGPVGDNEEALVRGSMGHVGAGHFYMRHMLRQRGEDVNAYYPPEDAIHEWVRRNPVGAQWLDRMIECLRRYVAEYPEAPGRRILGVEMPIRAVVGWRAGEWGLWVLAAHETGFGRSWRAWSPTNPSEEPEAHVGGRIRPATLDVPGHSDHGEPILFTRRLDLVIEDRAGHVYVWDHKFTAADTGAQRAAKYAMDGQFAGARILARQLWGDRFADATLNLVQSEAPWKVGRPAVPATPWRDRFFPRDIYMKAHEIARLQRDIPNPHEWPMAQHEQVCSSRYGDCPMLKNGACRIGPAALGS